MFFLLILFTFQPPSLSGFLCAGIPYPYTRIAMVSYILLYSVGCKLSKASNPSGINTPFCQYSIDDMKFNL
ncbi:hypothetical protein Xvie_00594 [Xenorhabdus vietnamensis]|uniref:Uncharacterized protein n=1 Tax=Xenorhabdus vietnamensis TaxID=351656 RepID=A0A1Y2SHN7_9GAMM|nr:hypothetical protein Xvie_00594 [Xenorhabdus vietnamensis]